ncbi:hypothetical protein D3C76_1223920 [compost metagenome]
MCQNGIVRRRFIRPIWRSTSCNSLHMSIFCPTFRTHQIVVIVYFVKMWTLREFPSATSPDQACIAKLLTRFNINLTLVDPHPLLGACACEINLSIIKKQGGINAFLLHIKWIRPFACRVIRPNVEMTSAILICRNHIKTTVIITKSRRPNTSGHHGFIKLKLILTSQTVPKLLPMHQILAVPNGYSRRIGK